MSVMLEFVEERIKGIEEYEKKTGKIDAPIYLDKSDLLCIKDRLRALDIIVNKRVNTLAFLDSLVNKKFKYSNGLDYYNREIGFDTLWLTQEEYDLLEKEIMFLYEEFKNDEIQNAKTNGGKR